MNLEQLIITAIIAAVCGALLYRIGSQISVLIGRYYRKMTFKHEYLTPYQHKNNKDAL